MEVDKILGIHSGDFYGDYMLDASSTAGAVMLRSTATNSGGEVVNATTTAAVDALGIAHDTITYTAAPDGSMGVFGLVGGGSPSGSASGGNALMGALARITHHPFQIVRARISGGATVGTALAGPAASGRNNILRNTTADATGLTVADVGVSTVTFAGGLMIGRTGANQGQRRRISTHTDSTSEAVTVAFVSTIAVNDTFYAFPYSKAGIAVQLTSDLTEANGIIATGTGAAVKVYDVVVDQDTDRAWVLFLFSSHFYSHALG